MSNAPTTAGTYRTLFAIEHARPLIGWSILARMPLGMTPLALLLLARGEGASYAVAGVVTAAYGLAIAVGAPVAGRLVDRRGPRLILLRRAAVYPGLLLAIAVLAVVDAPMAAIGAVAAAAGVAIPPIAPTVRSVWPRLVPDDLRGAAYGLEASAQELFFVFGPLLAAVLCALHPAGGLIGAAGAALVGTVALALLPPVRETEASDSGGGLLGALEARGVQVIAGFGLTIGLAFGTVEIAFPAFAEQYGARELGGIGLASIAVGSFVGGILVGARAVGDPLRRFLMVAPTIGVGFALLATAGSIPMLCVFAFIAGFPIAPAVAAAYLLIDGVARPWAIAESFAWFGTAISLGAATGTALGGSLVDHFGVSWAFGVGALVAWGGSGLLWLLREALVPAPA